MYRQESSKQLSFEDFYLPFAGHLDPNNRWMRLAVLIPCDKFEESYADQFAQSGQGVTTRKSLPAILSGYGGLQGRRVF